MNGTVAMYADRDNWPGQPDMGFGKAVWDAIQAATRARIAAGGRVDGPAWMETGR